MHKTGGKSEQCPETQKSFVVSFPSRESAGTIDPQERVAGEKPRRRVP